MEAKRLQFPPPGPKDAHEDDSLKEGKADPSDKYRTVAKRLEALFGLGEHPLLRRKVYQKIQRAAIEHGPECYDVIRLAVSAAQAADKPDRYFVAAVTRELKVLEYWERPVNF